MLDWLFSKQKRQIFDGSNFSNMKTCCFYSSYMIVNGIFGGFGVLTWQNKAFDDVTLGSRKLWFLFKLFYFMMFSRPNYELINTKKDCQINQ